MAKGNADLQTSTVAVAEFNEYLESFDLDGHIKNLKAYYKKREISSQYHGPGIFF